MAVSNRIQAFVFYTSMITSKAANCYHFKTGQGKVPELKCFTLSLTAQATLIV
jgi:hypothetical protein